MHSEPVWAIELRAGTVVGCCGPLHHKEIDARYLHAFDYDREGAAALRLVRDAGPPPLAEPDRGSVRP